MITILLKLMVVTIAIKNQNDNNKKIKRNTKSNRRNNDYAKNTKVSPRQRGRRGHHQQRREPAQMTQRSNRSLQLAENKNDESSNDSEEPINFSSDDDGQRWCWCQQTSFGKNDTM